MNDNDHDIKSGIVAGFACFLVTGNIVGSIMVFVVIMVSTQMKEV